MKDLALLYVGALTPDSLASRNEATSAAGEIFQRSFLTGLSESSLPVPEVLAYVPVPSFPKAPLVVRGGEAQGPDCRTLGHVNLGPLKIVTLGVTAAWALARWAWRNRGKRKVALVYNLNAPPAAALLPVCRLLGVSFVPFVGDIYVPGEVVDGGLCRRLEFWLQRRTVPRADGLLVCNRAIVDDLAPGREALLVEGGVADAFLDRFEALSPGGEGPGIRGRESLRTPRYAPENGAAPHPFHLARGSNRTDEPSIASPLGGPSSPPDGRGVPAKPFHIVFAGGLTSLNGVTVLLGALTNLKDLDLRVTIAGRGEHEAVVRAAAARDPRIDFRGLIPHDAVMALYEEADLLLSLRRTGSRTERYVFPSKVVECLGTGRPLLTTATGHVRQEFGEVAYLLDELTPAALAARLREIVALSPEERVETGRRARNLVRETRTWAGHARRIEGYLRGTVLAEAA